jgi:hypothetical protein
MRREAMPRAAKTASPAAARRNLSRASALLAAACIGCQPCSIVAFARDTALDAADRVVWAACSSASVVSLNMAVACSLVSRAKLVAADLACAVKSCTRSFIRPALSVTFSATVSVSAAAFSWATSAAALACSLSRVFAVRQSNRRELARSGGPAAFGRGLSGRLPPTR